MAQFDKSLIAALFVLFNVVITYGQHPRCYFCRTFIEGEVCNDPVNLTAIARQDCSDFSIFANGLVDRPKDIVSNSESTVCAKISYTNNGTLFTLRGCEFEQYDNTDFCAYARLENSNSPSLNFSDYSCSVCKSDFCNSATSTYVPFGVVVFSVIISLYR